MKSFTKILSVFALLLTFSNTLIPSGIAAENFKSLSIPQSKTNKSYIVKLKSSESISLNSNLRALQQTVNNTQSRFLQKAQQKEVKVVRTFKYLPYIVLEGSQADMVSISQFNEVDTIKTSKIVRPALKESVPLIGADKAQAAGFGGKGKMVAVLDTGVDTNHPAFAGKTLKEACFSSNLQGGKSLCPKENGQEKNTGSGTGKNCETSFSQDCIHGTHVAGIAVGNDTQKNIVGVAPEADLAAIQVFTAFCSGSFCQLGAFDHDIIAGLEHVLELKNQGLDIASANLSLGGGNYRNTCNSANPAFKDIVSLLNKAGVATVVAAGNNGNNNGMSFPACVSGVVSVGSTTKNDSVSSFSNIGRKTTLLAPGSNITSALPNNRTGALSGTSMAAPHIAGSFAVLKNAAPTASVKKLVKIMRKKGKKIKDSRKGNGFTKRRVDLEKVLRKKIKKAKK